MNTWNTIRLKRTTALEGAVATLETLLHPDHIPVIEFLTEHGESTLIELAIHTGHDSSFLEELLDTLLQTGVVLQYDNLYGNKYLVDYQRIAKVNAIVKLLVNEK